MPQVGTADILRRATPGSGTPLEAILRLLAQRAQPGAAGFPGGSPPEGRELSSQRLGNLADLTAQIFGRTPQEAVAAGADAPVGALPAVGTLRAMTPKARPVINKFMEEIVPALRARLASPVARRGQRAIPSESAENVFDVGVVPQSMVTEIVEHLEGSTQMPLGFQHARFGAPGKVKGEISPGVLMAEESARFTAPHEFAHTVFPQLRPTTVNRFVKQLAGPEGKRLFSNVVQEAFETGSLDKANAAGYLHNFLVEVDNLRWLGTGTPAFRRAVNEIYTNASEVFARMFEGAIPPTRTVRKLMSKAGKERVALRAEDILGKRGAIGGEIPGHDIDLKEYLESLMEAAP